MANLIENRITLHGDSAQIRAMLEAIQNEEVGVGSVDFNKIIPMPESLDIEAGTKTIRGLKAYQDFIQMYTVRQSAKKACKAESEDAFLMQRKDIGRDEWELGKIAWNNICLYGAPTWYQWCNRNWGTKWNAYGYHEGGIDYHDGDCLYFKTAWWAPRPVLDKLAELYPHIEIKHEWADEEIGQNCGRCKYQDGERIEEYFPEDNREAVAFACQVWNSDPVEFGLYLNVSGTGYVYVEDKEYRQIELFGKRALFTDACLTDEDIPRGLYCYHLQYSDGGSSRFCLIEAHKGVAHNGSVITKEPLDFGEQAYLPFTDYKFLGDDFTLGQFMKLDVTRKEDMEQPQEGMQL